MVEDDQPIGSGLVRVLESQGYAVGWHRSGRPALGATDDSVHLVILDLGLPDIDGVELCRHLRRAHPHLTIMILSARAQELDIVAGLDAGADDYLIKPFRLAELLARVRAHMRRSEGREAAIESEPIVVGALRLNQAARRAWKGDLELTLRPKEFDLLALLIAEAGRVVSRERIIREVWETEWMGSTKTLDTHIHALRQAIGAGSITTLRGVGYRLEVE